MTLITAIINSNIKCLAGDTLIIANDKSGYRNENVKKVLKIKYGMAAIYNYFPPQVFSRFQVKPHQLSINKLKGLARKSCPNNNNEFIGIFYISCRSAKLYYYPFNLEFDLNSKNEQIDMNNYIDSYIKKILVNGLIFNPIINNGLIDIEYYQKLTNCFINSFEKIEGINYDIEKINFDNAERILIDFYSKVFKDSELNRNIIGGKLRYIIIEKSSYFKSELIKV